jgi:translation initiation factor eIF-2B subunit gamma
MLDHTTPTAELLRIPQVQAAIKSDFLLLPCDLICDVPGEIFLETYLTALGGLGGVGTSSGSDFDASESKILGLGGERSGRRGGLSIWYNAINREESVKSEECDFMCTAQLDIHHVKPPAISHNGSDHARGTLRKLVWAMPMSELQDKCEEDKSWNIRQSLLRRYGSVKCLTKYRDAHIYLFPYWVKDFARLNEDFESVSEDLVGTWAKTEWRKPAYRARFNMPKLFSRSNGHNDAQQRTGEQIPIEDEIDLLSLSSTRTTRKPASSTSTAKQTAQLASRVQADPEDSILSPEVEQSDADADNNSFPLAPPILSYILSSAPSAPLIRRIDTTPLLLSVSLLLAKIPSLEETSPSGKHNSVTSPFAHQSKVAGTTTIAQQVTITRSDTLIDSNTTIAPKCVIKASVIGSSVTIGAGTRLTNCLIMDGAAIGERCVLTGTVVGKKANIGRGCTLTGCEVQDGNVLSDGTDGKKGEKFLVGGLEDEVGGDEGFADDGDE